jgi:hypothetical protein
MKFGLGPIPSLVSVNMKHQELQAPLLPLYLSTSHHLSVLSLSHSLTILQSHTISPSHGLGQLSVG